MAVAVVEEGVSEVQLGGLVWPLGLHHEGVSAWFLCLVTHRARTTGPLVAARLPSAACCKACLKCGLCVSALREQRRSVGALCRSAARDKHGTERKPGGS